MSRKLLGLPSKGLVGESSDRLVDAVTVKPEVGRRRLLAQIVCQPADSPEGPVLSSPALFRVHPECSESSAAAINQGLRRRLRVAEGKTSQGVARRRNAELYMATGKYVRLMAGQSPCSRTKTSLGKQPQVGMLVAKTFHYGLPCKRYLNVGSFSLLRFFALNFL
jgi:hypothetical protein